MNLICLHKKNGWNYVRGRKFHPLDFSFICALSLKQYIKFSSLSVFNFKSTSSFLEMEEVWNCIPRSELKCQTFRHNKISIFLKMWTHVPTEYKKYYLKITISCLAWILSTWILKLRWIMILVLVLIKWANGIPINRVSPRVPNFFWLASKDPRTRFDLFAAWFS